VTSDEKAKLDRWLNRALAEYSKEEPRSGIELRVLANLRAQRRHIAEQRRRRWWTIGIIATAAVLVIVLWAAGTNKHTEQEASVKPSPAVSPNNANVAQQASQDSSQDAGQNVTEDLASQTSRPASSRHSHMQRARRRSHGRRTARVLRAAQRVRGEQFPSPTPLSEQERILQRYVAQYKNDAIRTARALTELAKKEEQEVATTSTTSDESSDQDKP